MTDKGFDDLNSKPLLVIVTREALRISFYETKLKRVSYNNIESKNNQQFTVA